MIAGVRRCTNCGSDKTYTRKRGWASWNRHDGKWYCHTCWSRLFAKKYPEAIKKQSAKNNPRLMKFRDKQIYLKENPRKGECSFCKKKVGDEYINCYGNSAILKRTGMHHLEYHNDDPLKDTVELCVPCHMKESWRLGQYKNTGQYKRRA